MACGERTIPSTVDALATDTPNAVWCYYPVSEAAFNQGLFREVSYKHLANAIDRLAWHLDGLLPERVHMNTVAYIGPTDIRYFMLACAACKCRLKVCLKCVRCNLVLGRADPFVDPLHLSQEQRRVTLVSFRQHWMSNSSYP